MLAALITLPHFSVSSATSFPNSAGVIRMGSPASSARRACNFGSANTAFTAWFSFSTIAGGVSRGAAIPYQRGHEARHEAKFRQSAYFGTLVVLRKKSFHSPNFDRDYRTLATLKAKTS